MSLYVIGDLHLSLTVEKPMDIFNGWGNYVERLTSSWQQRVKAEDTVVILGDVSWGMSLEDAYADFEYINRLNGKKIIIKGNHDYWWTTRRKLDAWLEKCGFDTIRILHNDSYVVENTGICGTRSWFFDENEAPDDRVYQRELGRLTASIKSLEGKETAENIAFLHYPPIYKNSCCEDIVKLLKENGIRRCYYAHVHGESIAYAFNGIYDGVEFRLVSADFLHFEPYIIK